MSDFSSDSDFNPLLSADQCCLLNEAIGVCQKVKSQAAMSGPDGHAVFAVGGYDMDPDWIDAGCAVWHMERLLFPANRGEAAPDTLADEIAADYRRNVEELAPRTSGPNVEAWPFSVEDTKFLLMAVRSLGLDTTQAIIRQAGITVSLARILEQRAK